MEREFLKKIPVFQNLGDDELETISKRFLPVTFEKDQIVFKEGQDADSLYYVFSGHLGVYISRPTGEEMVARKNPGDFFGLKSILLAKFRTATIKALEKCQLYTIQRKDFIPCLSIQRVFNGMIKYLSEHNYFSDQGSSKASQVYAFFSPKGGVGKSILATNFAYALAKKCNSPTLFVDLCLDFGETRVLFGKGKQETHLPFKLPIVVDKTFDVSILQSDKAPLLFFLDTPERLEAAVSLRKGLTSSVLVKWFQKAREHFSHIVIDIPSVFDKTTLCALNHADRVILVANPQFPTLVRIRKFLEEMREYQAGFLSKTSIVLNGWYTSPDSKGGFGQYFEKAADFFLPFVAKGQENPRQTFEPYFRKPVDHIFPWVEGLGDRSDLKPFFIDTLPNHQITNLFIRFLNQMTGMTVQTNFADKFSDWVAGTKELISGS